MKIYFYKNNINILFVCVCVYINCTTSLNQSTGRQGREVLRFKKTNEETP